MPVTAIVGAQWGDEGKGRMVDYLADAAQMVIRFQGGDNAGHTVVNEVGRFALHMVPSGIFNPSTDNIIGPGTVVNPPALLEEMSQLAQAGVCLHRLWLSERAHVVLPEHLLLDAAKETAKGGAALGTTRRGIGPAYADKAARIGIRLGDLKRPEWLRARLSSSYDLRAARLRDHGIEPEPLEAQLAWLLDFGERLGHRIVDTTPILRRAIEVDAKVVLEGQLGIMRDLDWGAYPYVTSSNPMAGGAAVGAGLPPRYITDVLGVMKVYTTTVGAGPFPTELKGAMGEALRAAGQEFGATTGRPRRCGWFDAVCARQGAWLNGLTALAITKIDVLDTFEALKICTGYLLDGKPVDALPDTPDLERVQPIYEDWPGWQTSTREARHWHDLPEQAQRFLSRVSELTEVPIKYVSVGPERDQLITLEATDG